MSEPPVNTLAKTMTSWLSEFKLPGMNEDTQAAFEDMIDKLGSLGPEYDGGLSNHGPMAVEALHHLGRDAKIPAWSERYIGKLEPALAATGQAPRLGTFEHHGDWARLFEAELAERDWREVVGRWIPQLGSGVFAGATHGLLRTAHAIRSLREADTPLRRRELARGLAYWAARHQPLPGMVRARGRRTAADLLATLPAIPRTKSFLISEAIHDIDRVPELAEHLSQLDPAELEPGRLLAALAPWAGAGASVSVFAHIHVLTASVALLQLADLLSPAALGDLLEHAWHAVAAVIATWRPAAPLSVELAPPGRDVLIEQALTCENEHAIKLVDACLTGFDRYGHASLLHAAEALIRALSERR